MAILLVLVLCVGLTVYSETVRPIGIIENVKRALGEMMQSSISDVQNVTTIDVTGIELGIETQHEHVYKTMYDEEKHWEECTICRERQNEIVHSFKTTWALGRESCQYNNYYTKTCSCGYSETGHKPCVWDGSSYCQTSVMHHTRKCKVCSGQIQHSYYLNSYGSGNLYDATFNTDYIYTNPYAEYCYKSDGTILSCRNAGTCVKCKKVWSYNHKLAIDTKEGKVYCAVCGSNFGTVSTNITKDSNIPITYTIVDDIVLENGVVYTSKGASSMEGAGTATVNITNVNTTKTELRITSILKFNNSWKAPFDNFSYTINTNMNGKDVSATRKKNETIFPDSKEPIISSINNGESEITDWSKSKPIVISGTENWTNTVKVKILDDENNEVFSGETVVSNGNYSISCTPDVEAGLEGRTFKVIVTDSCENSTEQEFTISKIDSIPPEVTSSAEVGGEWAKEKSFTATATDHGIGNVQIAFNDVSDYKLATKNGTEYTREYKLVGDVYSQAKARVFYKDELNNISSQEITIDKLDNTAPTITGYSFNNNKLILEANDIKEGIGEGSGVAKYRFVTSDTQYENPVVSKADSIEVNIGEDMIIPNIDKVKYVYVVAEDAVGNVSSVYEAEVPHIDLRTEVNLEAANGKGGVDLDWTGYDPSNKVFKAYQKKEGAEEFESISTVDFTKEIEPVKVLNVYPVEDDIYSGNKYIPVVNFEYLDGKTASLPKSAALKVWMEGGTMIEGSTTTTFEAYGKNPYTGQQIIKVTPVSNADFNNNPEIIWDYDVVMIGTWDANGSIYEQPNDAAVTVLEKYIKSGYGVLMGHDTILSKRETQRLRKYFNIDIGKALPKETDSGDLDYNTIWRYTSTYIKVNKSGLITNFPYEISPGSKLEIPQTHTCSNAALGNVWMTLVDGTDNPGNAGSINNYYNAGGQGDPQYYLTTYNNTAMIQTGHSNAESTADERKVLANTLFYLKQRTTETAFTDNSAQDLKAPNAPVVNAVREENKIKLTHNTIDNGSDYVYYVEAYDAITGKLLKSSNK